MDNKGLAQSKKGIPHGQDKQENGLYVVVDTTNGH